MCGTCMRSLLLVAAFSFVAACDELVPPEPEKPVAVVAKPVKTKPAATAPAPVKKKPVIVFDEGSGGGGWN
jgi:hypothetical protein